MIDVAVRILSFAFELANEMMSKHSVGHIELKAFSEIALVKAHNLKKALDSIENENWAVVKNA